MSMEQESDQVVQRRANLDELRKLGVDVYPRRFDARQTVEQIVGEHSGKTGEALRFGGSLPERIRELAICIVARETSNQFEWQTHAPKALEAGVAREAIDAVAAGRRPRGLTSGEDAVTDFVAELMQRHGVGDRTYEEAVRHFGEPGAVELTTLVGYFVMVCWVMNVARTPGPAGSHVIPLGAFPS